MAESGLVKRRRENLDGSWNSGDYKKEEGYEKYKGF